MKLKKLLIVGMLMLTPMCAKAQVTDIKPDKNIGVFRQTERVSFTVKRDTQDKEQFYYTIENMDGDQLLAGDVTAENASFGIDIGIMRSGWYRMRLSSGGSEVPIFASFTVLPSTGTIAENSPFSAMLVSAWGDCGERRADFAEALKKTGVSCVRDSALWCNGENDYKTLDGHISDLYQNGNEQLLTIDMQSDYQKAGYFEKSLYDVYEMHKGLAERFGTKVSAWDIINEPDINGYLSGDMFASYYKAAALGIEAGSASSEISFGGLCAPTDNFSDLLMQNDVMKYSTFMNVHSHTTESGLGYNAFPGAIAKKAKRLAALYGTNQPIWMTEAGIRMDVDENELPDAAALKEQAIYLTTSFAESIGKYGTGNHFWFLMRHYIEAGKEFGMASKNYMTYPGYLAFANLAYNLGEGIPIGEISYSDGRMGYFFDTGDGDAAILWNKTSDSSYMQFDCDKPIKITDVLGGTEVKSVMPTDGKVRVQVTQEPIIVRFGGKISESNYGKKSFPKYEKPIREKADYAVIQQIWDKGELEGGLRVLNVGEEFTVTVKMYNLNPSASVSGKISILADDNVEIVEQPTNTNYMISKYSDKSMPRTLTYKLRLKDTAEYASKGYIKFKNADDNVVSVCGYTVGNNVKYNESTYKQFSGAFLKYKWDTSNKTPGATCSVSSTLSSISFTLSFNGGDRCFYPYFKTTVPSNSEGVVFTRSMENIGGGGNSKIFAVTSDGKWFLATAGDFSQGSVTYVIPWSKFEQYGGGGESLDPTKICQFMLGFNTSSDSSVTYTVSKFGTYGSSYVKEDAKGIKINGIEDGETYVKGNLPQITVDCDAESVDLYVNFKKVGTFNKGKTISLNNVVSGAVSVIAAIKDEFGKITYDEVDIYIREYNDFSGKSAFY